MDVVEAFQILSESKDFPVECIEVVAYFERISMHSKETHIFSRYLEL